MEDYGTLPYLSQFQRVQFPHVETAIDGYVFIGGNLSPGMLLSAYEQGIFPWPTKIEGETDGPVLLWAAPEERALLFPSSYHTSKRLLRTIRNVHFSFSIDAAFSTVIDNCTTVCNRSDETWITPEIKAAYCELHRLGYAHSVEVWQRGMLCGGLYGISLGHAFFGESMFSYKDNASKAAFAVLVSIVQDFGLSWIDCQIPTSHLASLGACTIARHQFHTLLARALEYPTKVGHWGIPQSHTPI